jgi:uncharacterized cupredoxin-like copper-binding protein
MKPIHIRLVAALMAASLAGMAHAGQGHSGSHGGQSKKEQKEWGVAGSAKQVRRSITITMTDKMRFSPDSIEVKQGETVKLVVRNAGKTMHELVLGTKKDLEEHAALMAKFPGMEHDEPHMTHVRPGKTGEIIWTFNRAGEFDFACLIPGHYPAGMVGKIKVVSTAAKGDGHGSAHKH